MARTAVATYQTIWDCRWSRPSLRLLGLAVPQQAESLWICTRNGRPHGVSEEQCEHCPHWQMEDTPEE